MTELLTCGLCGHIARVDSRGVCCLCSTDPRRHIDDFTDEDIRFARTQDAAGTEPTRRPR